MIFYIAYIQYKMIKDFYFLILSSHYKESLLYFELNKFKSLVCCNNKIILQHTEFFKTENKKLYKHHIDTYQCGVFYPSYVKQFLLIEDNKKYKKKFLKKFKKIEFYHTDDILNFKKYNYNDIFILMAKKPITKIIYPKKPVIQYITISHSGSFYSSFNSINNTNNTVLNFETFTNLKCLAIKPSLSISSQNLKIILPKHIIYNLYLRSCNLLNCKKNIKCYKNASDISLISNSKQYYYHDNQVKMYSVLHSKHYSAY